MVQDSPFLYSNCNLALDVVSGAEDGAELLVYIRRRNHDLRPFRAILKIIVEFEFRSPLLSHEG